MTTTDEMEAAYASSRGRIAALTRDLGGDTLATTVPCCPKWSVQDLVGHLAGVLEDRHDGRMPTGGFPEWTDAQVARHRGQPVGEVLDSWVGAPIEPELAMPSLSALCFDVVTHEHDLCEAIGVAGPRDTESVRVGAVRAAERMTSSLDAAGAPSVRVTTEDGEQLLGTSRETVTLDTTRFGLMRLVTARMSRAQAEAMRWGGDPGVVLDALVADGFFTLQPRDVPELDAG